MKPIKSKQATDSYLKKWHVPLARAQELLNRDPAQLFIELLRHGSLSVELFSPIKIDPQSPHLQDELYVIVKGSGEFILEEERCNFQAGDVLYVPAGWVHRFENFSPDFQTWVVFYGPNGGEKNHFETQKAFQDQIITITTAPEQFDLEVVYQYLTNSYWAKGRSKAKVEKSISNSLCFGVFSKEKQIGFARVITDYATFAYLADVFILPPFQGIGIGKWLIQTILEFEALTEVTGILLKTGDAQTLYQKFGFTSVDPSISILEKRH